MSDQNAAVQAGQTGTSGSSLLNHKHAEPEDNRYTQQLTDIQNSAAFGVNIGKVIAAKSGGRKDYSKDIQFSIRREFFTFKQFIIGMFWAIILGLFIGTLVMSLVVPGAQWDVMAYPTMTIGVFVLAMGISDVFAEAEAFSSVRKCTSKKQKIIMPGADKATQEYILDADFRGAPCLTPFDCTKGGHLKPGQRGACSVSHGAAWGGVIKAKRTLVTPIVLLTGIGMVSYAFSTSNERPSAKNLLLSSVFGIFSGTALALIFS
jgi:hypothetical protein